MKPQSSLIIVCFLVVASYCLVASSSGEGQSNEQSSTDVSNRNTLVPPKLFDFERFKTTFRKSYGSVMEELARQKLFFARAFRAFLSFIQYKHYKSTSFQKINPMSDWTQAELRAIERRPSIEPETAPKEDSEEAEEEKAVDLDEIEQKLKQLVNEHKDEPGYAEIAAELNHATSRRKRDIKRRDLTVDDLFGEFVVYEDDGKNAHQRVPSNNPDYEQPEMISFGAEDGHQVEPMAEWQAKMIASIPGIGYIGSLLNDAKNSLLGRPVVIERADLPDEVFVDHRESGCLARIRHQGECGSCYIFSTLALYEYVYCRETGKLVEFSEKYPLDCGPRVGMLGCEGGLEVNVGKFFGEYGVELRSNYPYRDQEDTCPYEDSVPSKKMGYLKVNEAGLKTIKFRQIDEYLKQAPVLMGFGVSDEFHYYGGGVDMGQYCDRHRGHSMLVIGSGREDGVEYYLVRNSYGTWFGEDGHYKIAKKATNCFLDRGAGFVLSAKHGSVFGSVNKHNDGKAVRENTYEQNKYPAWLKNKFNAVDANIVTPPPHLPYY